MLLRCHRFIACATQTFVSPLRPSMSLEELWSAHRSRCAPPCTASLSSHAFAREPSSSVSSSSPRSNKRKRPSESNNTASLASAPAKSSKTHVTDFPAGQTDLGSGSVIIVTPRAFQRTESQKLFRSLQEEVQWLHKEVTIYGKKVMQPRQVAYMASDKSLFYTYSHTKMQPEAWHPQVEQIKSTLEGIAGVKFNSCLLNLYRDGSDYMGWHSDNEKLYGDDPTIGSVSFGATRRFVLRKNQDHSDKWGYDLASGDVLVMKGSTQQHWTHSIPKMMRVTQPRINLTFRQILQPES